MPDEIHAILRRLDSIERNQTDAAKTTSIIIEEIHGVKTDRAVRMERDKALGERFERIEERRTERDKVLADRFERIEERLNSIYKIGWWFLAVFGAGFIALVANFTYRGGFYVP